MLALFDEFDNGISEDLVPGVYPAHIMPKSRRSAICGHYPMQETPIHSATRLQASISRSA
jgi:hypothetical protein